MPLTAREAGPPFTHLSCQTLGQALQDLAHPGLPCRDQHLFIAGVRFADADVVGNRALEQVGILENLADLVGQYVAGYLPDIHATHLDLSLADIEKACDQPQQGGFPRAGCPDQCRHAARFDSQADVTEHGGLICGIPETDVAQLDRGIGRDAW